MAKKKRHSRVEIASKLAQANDLATQGAGGASARISGDPRGGSALSDAQRGRPNCRTPAREFTVATAGDRSTPREDQARRSRRHVWPSQRFKKCFASLEG